MADVNHTPGPWNAVVKVIGICISDGEGDGNYPLCASFVDTPNGDIQVQQPWTARKTGRQLFEDRIPNANAMLMAAAPELLDALKAYVDSEGGPYGRSDDQRKRDKRLTQARNAIAKAQSPSPAREQHERR